MKTDCCVVVVGFVTGFGGGVGALGADMSSRLSKSAAAVAWPALDVGILAADAGVGAAEPFEKAADGLGPVIGALRMVFATGLDPEPKKPPSGMDGDDSCGAAAGPF